MIYMKYPKLIIFKIKNVKFRFIIEYKKTLEILDKQKKKLMVKIEDKAETLDNMNNYIIQMIKIDQNIKECIKKIQKLDNKIQHIKNNDKDNNNKKISNNLNNIEENNNEKIETSINKNEHSTINFEKEKTINTEKKMISDINKNKGKINIKVKLSKKNFEIIYAFKNKSTNYYFYQSKNRPECEGLGKFLIIEQKLVLTRKCSEASLRDDITYKVFCEIFYKDK